MPSLDLSLGSEGLAFQDLIDLLGGLSLEEFLAGNAAPFLLQVPLTKLEAAPDLGAPQPEGQPSKITQRVEQAGEADPARTCLVTPEEMARKRSKELDGIVIHRLASRAGREELVIGRSQGCDVVLHNPTVSQRHAKLFLGRNRVVDLDSRNGTFVDRQRIPPHEPLPLQDRQNVTFGSYRTIFMLPRQVYLLAARLRG